MVAASKSRSLSLLWIKLTLPKEHDERSSTHKGEGRNMQKLPLRKNHKNHFFWEAIEDQGASRVGS